MTRRPNALLSSLSILLLLALGACASGKSGSSDTAPAAGAAADSGAEADEPAAAASADNAASSADGASASDTSSTSAAADKGAPMSLYDIKTVTLTGEPADLSAWKGKVTLVVNVASKCGFTPQYEGLQTLHAELSDQGFAVLGFPSNEFGGQEPGSGEEIAAFCSSTYGVEFPMFEKVEVKPGPKQSPVYRFLTAGGNVPRWNFSKYLVGPDGQVISFHESAVTPEELRPIIEGLLAS